MPAYNFKAQFAKMVESGKKTQTIRKVRKYPTKPGQTIYLYAGMRTKRCRKLGEGEIISVEKIEITNLSYFKFGEYPDIQWFDAKEDDAGLMLAKADGFEDWESFVEFFKIRYGLPFQGELIKWRLIDG